MCLTPTIVGLVLSNPTVWRQQVWWHTCIRSCIQSMHTRTPGIAHIPVGCGKAGAVGSTGPDSDNETVFTCCVSSVGQVSKQTMSGLINSILKVDITI